MIRCPECDTEATPGMRFCPGCGEALYQKCASCDGEVGVWMAFCPYCGAKAGESVRQGGEESDVRLATVLFGDVKGFTAMSERIAPEEVTDIMNRCFEVLSEPIVRYGGTIDKFVGDAIMARFGAPQAHEDDPVRAVHAALEMQEALKQFAADLEAERGFSLAMRIGINTGQVLAGQVGSSALKQFTLMGNTVNLASRLEHEAEPGYALVGETTYRLSRHAFEYRAMPPMEIRGQSEPINAFVPLRPKATTSGARTQAGERRLGLVGRHSELEQLDGFLGEALEGQGRLVAITADPGIGKSRLVEEFWQGHREEGLTRVYASAQSFGQTMPYSFLSGFIRSLVFGDMDDTDPAPEELRDQLIALLPEQTVNDAVALLGDVLGIAVEVAADVAHLEARSRQGLLTNVLKAVLAARSMQHPLILVLEDVHWADSASVDVLDKILSGIQNMQVLVLMTHRPRFSHPWSGMGFYRQVNLQELPIEDAVELLREFFGSYDFPAGVSERVVAKAGGNPFFLEQILNNLVSSGVIVEQNGTWVPTRDVESIEVPDTIHGILQARVDQIPRPTRAVLEVAAVIGRIFAYRLLEAVADSRTGLPDHLDALQRQDFVSEKSILPELEYMFTNSLTQDVVYNSVLEARRKVLHEKVAQAIESLGITMSAEQLPLLAVHYEKTANREKALEYALAAAERSRELYANQDAITHYLQVLEIVEEDPSRYGDRMLEVLESLGDLYELIAEFKEAEDYYKRATDATEAPSDGARLLRKLGELAEMSGRYAEASSYYREAEDALSEVDDPAERVQIYLALARMDRSRGALDTAAQICLRALSLAGKVGDAVSAHLYFELGEVERERGHLRSASGYLQAASSVWEQMGALEKQALVNTALADVSYNRGELADALSYYQKALETQQRVLDRQGMATTLFGIGRAVLALGDDTAAIERFNEAMSIAREIGAQLLVANCMLQIGMIYLERGDVPEAERLIMGGRAMDGLRVRGAYDEFKKMRNWRGAAYALGAEARVRAIQGRMEDARKALRRTQNLAAEMNDPWLQTLVDVGTAELEESAGDLEAAAEHAAAAVSRARDLSDPRTVARAERILGRVRARQGQRKESLILLSNSSDSMRRTGAKVDAARAALDYVVAAQGLPEVADTARAMLSFALETFQACDSQRDLQIARMIAERTGLETVTAVEAPG
jgi:predicted ATPase/class 3 adenylate cyclase